MRGRDGRHDDAGAQIDHGRCPTSRDSAVSCTTHPDTRYLVPTSYIIGNIPIPVRLFVVLINSQDLRGAAAQRVATDINKI